MFRITLLAMMISALVSAASPLLAAPPVIGTVAARGSFQLDQSRVTGNGTLLEGAVVETSRAMGRVELRGGTRMLLAAESRGRVYSDHLVLERGQGQMENALNYAIQAGGLRILPAAREASARVVLAGPGRVQVAAVTGDLRVLSSEGVLIARMSPGSALEFQPQPAGASAPSRLAGCLQQSDSRFLLTDDTTHVKVELVGPGLGKEVGNRIEIQGPADPLLKPAAGAVQVVKVSQLKRLGKGCSVSVSAAASKTKSASGGQTGAASSKGAATTGAAGKAGLTVAAKAAIIGGVACSAAVGGLAAAGALPGQDDEQQPISR